jgi:dihydropteroate synthase
MQNSGFSKNKTWNVRGELVDLSTPKVMGILNVTPDSFYEGSRVPAIEQAVTQAEKMVAEGAMFLDIGGYSSRPGATNITVSDERRRVIPVVEAIAQKLPRALISIDTFRPEVADAALQSGAHIVNDITAGGDPKMAGICLKHSAPIILMHMRGTPQTMATLTEYEQVTTDVIRFLADRVGDLTARGVKDIAVDPGFGFAKTAEQSFTVLDQLENFILLGYPVLVGLSRKSMIWRTLGITAEESLNGTTTLNAIALMKGADILRVHDVKPAMECIRLVGKLQLRSGR